MTAHKNIYTMNIKQKVTWMKQKEIMEKDNSCLIISQNTFPKITSKRAVHDNNISFFDLLSNDT